MKAFGMPRLLNFRSLAGKLLFTCLLAVLWMLYLCPAEADEPSFHLPEELTTIEKDAFSGLPAIENLTIPDRVTSIGANAFAGTKINTLILPEHPMAYDTVQESSFNWDVMNTVFVYKGDAQNSHREPDLYDFILTIQAEQDRKNHTLKIIRTDPYIRSETNTEVAFTNTVVRLTGSSTSIVSSYGWQWEKSWNGENWTVCSGGIGIDTADNMSYTFYAAEGMARYYRCTYSSTEKEIISENIVEVLFIPGNEVNLRPKATVDGTSVHLSWEEGLNENLKGKVTFSVYMMKDETPANDTPNYGTMMLIEDEIPTTDYTLEALRPNTRYQFVVSVDTPGAYSANSNKVFSDTFPEVKTGNAPEANESVYRALLIAEVDFPGDICTRNMADVRLMRNMLRQVIGSNGTEGADGLYSIAIRKNPGPNQILTAISDTFQDADENDVALFFIATHGNVTETGDQAGRLYTPNGETLLLKYLADALAAVPGKIIVFLESCGSGAAVYDPEDASLEVSAEAMNNAVIRAFSQTEQQPGIGRGILKTGEFRTGKFRIITASAYQQKAWGREGGSDNGNYFPKALVSGVLEKADLNNKGQVTLDALYRYIRSVIDPMEFFDTESTEGAMYVSQDVQVWPKNCSDPLFLRVSAD